MMDKYKTIQKTLLHAPEKWLVAGVSGSIGSSLLEVLLKLDQQVVGLYNLLTGYRRNLDEVEILVSPKQRSNLSFIEGDIKDSTTCQKACDGIDYVLYQAALGSLPRSIENRIATNENNLVGFLNMIVAAKDSKARRFIYAASNSVYGDHPDLPKTEENEGGPLSPYTVTKKVNEIYADIFAEVYGFQSIGLRYFNVFGPSQDPNGPYAAVIPKWFNSLKKVEKFSSMVMDKQTETFVL